MLVCVVSLVVIGYIKLSGYEKLLQQMSAYLVLFLGDTLAIGLDHADHKGD